MKLLSSRVCNYSHDRTRNNVAIQPVNSLNPLIHMITLYHSKNSHRWLTFMDDSSGTMCFMYMPCTAVVSIQLFTLKMRPQDGWLTFNVLLVYMWKPNPSGPLSMVTSLRPFKMVAPPLSPLVDMSDHRTLSFDFEGAIAECLSNRLVKMPSISPTPTNVPIIPVATLRCFSTNKYLLGGDAPIKLQNGRVAIVAVSK